jgi:hypothetical protein
MLVTSLNPFIPRLLTLNELSGLADASLLSGIAPLRPKHRIAVLDDDANDQIIDKLGSLGYDLNVFRSFNSLGSKTSYAMFICDIFGTTSESKLDGAYAMQEIRRSNPLCYIICYTGASVNDHRLREAQSAADMVIRKGSSADLSQMVPARGGGRS